MRHQHQWGKTTVWTYPSRPIWTCVVCGKARDPKAWVQPEMTRP